LDVVFQPDMDVIKVEPYSDSEPSLASLLPHVESISTELEAENVPAALPMLKTEVKVRCESCLLVHMKV
jgi:hypothetical protein